MKLIKWEPGTDYYSYFLLKRKGDIVESLPCGHSRHFPVSFEARSKTVVAGEVNFYNRVFIENYSEKSAEQSLPLSDLQPVNKKLIFINLLDNCFGHSLLKLFHLSTFSFDAPGYDYLIIVPEAISHFIDIQLKHVHIRTVKGSFKSFENLGSFFYLFNYLSENYSEIQISLTTLYPVCTRHAIMKLTGANKGTKKESNPLIIFYYRTDASRKWNSRGQHKSVIGFFDFLRSFFSDKVDFVVVGDKDTQNFPTWIRDERVSSFSRENDLHYNSLFAQAVITIGLTGSHMLFPNVLSSGTAHLIQSYKIKNTAEDIVAMPSENSVIESYRHFFYYGNYDCSDILPEELGCRVLFHLSGRFEKEYKFSSAEMSQEEFIKKNFPFFRYEKVRGYREEYNNAQYKKIRNKNRIQKIFPF